VEAFVPAVRGSRAFIHQFHRWASEWSSGASSRFARTSSTVRVEAEVVADAAGVGQVLDLAGDDATRLLVRVVLVGELRFEALAVHSKHRVRILINVWAVLSGNILTRNGYGRGRNEQPESPTH